MRRRDREVTDMNEILRILKTANVLHLGLTDGDMPYVLPMNYGFSMEDGKLTFYIHGSKEGRKWDVIEKNPRCCAQIECEDRMFEGDKPCTYGYTYYCLMGFGKVEVIEDPAEKIKGMKLLMKNLTDKDFEFNERLLTMVKMARITCDSYTAKHRPLPLTKQDPGM